MRTYKTEGIILKRRNSGEADRVLTIFTKHYGKIYAVARGVRRITSRRGGNVEIFTHVSVFLIEGKVTNILTEAETIHSFQELRKDLQSVGYAYTICELIDKLLPEKQDHENVFYSAVNALLMLNKKEQKGEVVVEEFEKELMRLLGFWPKDKPFENINVEKFIEGIIERELKSKKLMQKLT